MMGNGELPAIQVEKGWSTRGAKGVQGSLRFRFPLSFTRPK